MMFQTRDISIELQQRGQILGVFCKKSQEDILTDWIRNVIEMRRAYLQSLWCEQWKDGVAINSDGKGHGYSRSR